MLLNFSDRVSKKYSETTYDSHQKLVHNRYNLYLINQRANFEMKKKFCKIAKDSFIYCNHFFKKPMTTNQTYKALQHFQLMPLTFWHTVHNLLHGLGQWSQTAIWTWINHPKKVQFVPFSKDQKSDITVAWQPIQNLLPVCLHVLCHLPKS